MMRNWKMLGVAAVIAVAANAAPLFAQTTDGPQPDDKHTAALKQFEASINAGITKAFEKVGEDLKGLKEDMRKLQEESKTDRLQLTIALGKIGVLETQIEVLNKKLEALQTKPATAEKVALYPPSEGKEVLDEIKSRLTDLEKAIRKLDRGPSLYPPATPNGNGSGRMVFVNAHVEYMLFRLDGREPIRVAPGATHVVENVPAGVVSYEVISPTYGLTRSSQPTLRPNDTITVTVR